MVLIAEQSYGKGRVVAFGDPSNVTNGITIGAHPFNGRLYSYLTHNPANGKSSEGSTPQAGWRQILGFMLAAALVVLLAKIRNPLGVGGGGAGAEPVDVGVEREGLGDGERSARWSQTALVGDLPGQEQDASPNYHGLAYIDNSHLDFTARNRGGSRGRWGWR